MADAEAARSSALEDASSEKADAFSLAGFAVCEVSGCASSDEMEEMCGEEASLYELEDSLSSMDGGAGARLKGDVSCGLGANCKDNGIG